MSSVSNVTVICRFRPVNEWERERDAQMDEAERKLEAAEFALKLEGGTGVKLTAPLGRGGDFVFDHVFDAAVTQAQVYDAAGRQVEDVLAGYNGTIFAYGQTGSGKTHTMMGGSLDDATQMGVIPRASAHLFRAIREGRDGTEFTIRASFLEIYQETIQDLLNPERNDQLRVRESPAKGVFVDGLTQEYVGSEADIMALIRIGEANRSVSATKMNQVSSRSHSLFIVTVEQRRPDGSMLVGKLNLADLAGSEKLSKSQAENATLVETKYINKSLHALGNCINALTQAGRSHIPYRDSKLTFILRESLGGNAKTALIVTCSPHAANVDETLNSLRFASRAKTITNRAKVNVELSNEQLTMMVAALRKELAILRKHCKSLEAQLAGKAPEGRARASSAAAAASPQSTASVGTSAGAETLDVSVSSDDSMDVSLASDEYDPMKVAKLQVQLQRAEERHAAELDAVIDRLVIQMESEQDRKQELADAVRKAEMEAERARLLEIDLNSAVLQEIATREASEYELAQLRAELANKTDALEAVRRARPASPTVHAAATNTVAGGGTASVAAGTDGTGTTSTGTSAAGGAAPESAAAERVAKLEARCAQLLQRNRELEKKYEAARTDARVARAELHALPRDSVSSASEASFGVGSVRPNSVAVPIDVGRPSVLAASRRPPAASSGDAGARAAGAGAAGAGSSAAGGSAGGSAAGEAPPRAPSPEPISHSAVRTSIEEQVASTENALAERGTNPAAASASTSPMDDLLSTSFLDSRAGERRKGPFHITVTEPVTVDTRFDSHTEYKITTETIVPLGDGARPAPGRAPPSAASVMAAAASPGSDRFFPTGADGFVVHRRFKDFVWLREQLMRQYPGRLIGLLPAKKVVGRFRATVVESRRRALQRFLARLAADRELAGSTVFHLFLFTPDTELKAMMKQASAELKAAGHEAHTVSWTTFNKSFRRSLAGTQALDLDADRYTQGAYYIGDLHSALADMAAVARDISDSQQSLAHLMNKMSGAVAKLADLERRMELARALEFGPHRVGPLLTSLAAKFELLHGIHIFHAATEDFHLADPLEEYIGLTEGLRNVMVYRQTSLKRYQKADAAYTAAVAKLEKTFGGEGEAASGVSDEPWTRMQDAKLDFLRTSNLLQDRLNEFHTEKTADLRDLLHTYVNAQLMGVAQSRQLWLTMLPQINALMK